MKAFMDFRIDVPPGVSGEVDTTCPECSADRKKKHARCLSVSLDKGTWICHHCGWRGSLKDGGQKADYAHWRKPKYRTPTPKSKAALPIKVITWFKGRGISEKTLLRNDIGYAAVYMPQEEDHVGAIVFPYRREGHLVNAKYRDGKKNFRMEAGAERILYGLDDIGSECLCVVEGEIDKLSVEEAGIRSCVSVPDGAPPPGAKDYASKFSFLESAHEVLAGVHKIVLAVDTDEPGQCLREELARRLGAERCYVADWPSDCKDANEVLVKYGPAMLKECIEEAAPYPVAGIFEVRDVSDRLDRLYAHGFERGVRTGWLAVDNLYTVRPGEWTLVTGVPAHGKSSWLEHLLVNIAAEEGWNFAIFSPEHQPIERHIARLMTKYVCVPFDNGPTPRMSEKTLRAGKAWLQDHFAWILPDEDGDWSVEHVLTLARALVLRRGIKGLVIDPWNELDHSRPGNLSETEYISRSLTQIRKFARLCGVHVWVVAHPTKLKKDLDGKYPIPTPYDVHGSANWRNKADNCITVFRHLDDPDKPVEIHVQKIRFDEIGRIGTAYMRYDRVTGRYAAVDEDAPFRRIK